jgi:hypothetical protein
MLSTLNIKLARTVWFNTYRGQVTDEMGNYVAMLRLIPSIPMAEAELPPDAPLGTPYITVIVEDGAFDSDDLIAFESNVSQILLEKMSQPPSFLPENCQFAYPSPPLETPNHFSSL